MNFTEWTETWKRIKDRNPDWQPTKTESEDWCMGLKVYQQQLVEEVGRWIPTQYSSKEPKLAWYIRECQRRKKNDMTENARAFNENSDEELREFEERKENVISKLEGTPIEMLREATISVLAKYGHLIRKPENGKPREWKQTLRAMVYNEIYGEKK